MGKHMNEQPADGVEALPTNCRNRLKAEGKPHPRSGCVVCKTGGLTGCPYERRTVASSEARAAADDLMIYGTAIMLDGKRIDPRTVQFDLAASKADSAQGDFQQRVAPWMTATFPPEVCADQRERGDRPLEEVLELLQAHGYDRSRVATLVDYVYGRPVGEPQQEVGGVMVTLAAFCLAAGLDMQACGDAELARVWTKIDVIRQKQASKRGLHTPLPTPQPEGGSSRIDRTLVRKWANRLRGKA